MYPIKAGLNSGDTLLWGILGFLLTSVLIPVIGLIGIIYFNGDYKSFFYRLGKTPGRLLIAFSMAAIGPFYAMSRIVTVCYEMLKPFLPDAMTGMLFSLLFCGLTFLATFRESKIIDLLGQFISPALLISMSVILVKGILTPQAVATTGLTAWQSFADQAVLGYAHLDLLGTIFFGSIVLSILKNNVKNRADYDLKSLSTIGMQAGMIGCLLLGVVYASMALLGAFYGKGMESVNIAQLFSLISFKILGQHGAFIIATAVSMACFSTIIALATVLAEYVQREISGDRVNYRQGLGIVLSLTALISCSGINTLLDYATPIINTVYPVLITLTLCNLAFSLFRFKPVKLPVFATLIVSIYLNLSSYGIYTHFFQ